MLPCGEESGICSYIWPQRERFVSSHYPTIVIILYCCHRFRGASLLSSETRNTPYTLSSENFRVRHSPDDRRASPRRGLSPSRIFNRIFTVCRDVAVLLGPKISALETTPGLPLCSLFFNFIFFLHFHVGFTACFDWGEREYILCPVGASFLAFHCSWQVCIVVFLVRPQSAGDRRRSWQVLSGFRVLICASALGKGKAARVLFARGYVVRFVVCLLWSHSNARCIKKEKKRKGEWNGSLH